MDINTAPLRDNTTLLNQSNPTNTAKVRCQNNIQIQQRPKSQNITPTHQHDVTHYATPNTVYKMQTEHPKLSNNEQ